MRFDEVTHTYYNDQDEVVPSTTQILKATGKIDTTWYHAGAADRGTIIHQMTEMMDQGLVELRDLQKYELYGYFEAYMLFKVDTGFEVDEIEVPFIHSLNGMEYAGTIDRRGRIGGYNYLIDIKSGSKARWHGLQLAAYSMAGNQEWDDTLRRRTLLLKRDGKYSFSDKDKQVGSYDDPIWGAYWQGCLAEFTWRNRGL